MTEQTTCSELDTARHEAEVDAHDPSDQWSERSRRRVRFLGGGLKDLAGTVIGQMGDQRILVSIEAVGDLLVDIDADSVAPLD